MKRKVPEPEVIPKLLYIMKEDDDSDKGYYLVAYETIEDIPEEGEVLIYEYKSKADFKIIGKLEPKG